MPFIGTQPDVGGYSVLDALTASATASYTLQKDSTNFVPSSANQLLVSLNGVIQKPGSSFTISGSTLTFSSALTSSDSIDFIIAMGEPLLVGVPSDATITGSKLASNIGISTTGNIATTGSGTLSVAGTAAITGNTTVSGTLTSTGKITSTAGILFGSDTADANTLNDYEIGSYSPTYTASSSAGSTSYTHQHGSYVKIGNLCQVWVDLTISSSTGMSGTPRMSLPFASANTSPLKDSSSQNMGNWWFWDMHSNFTSGNTPSAWVPAGVSYANMYVTNGAASSHSNMNVNTTGRQAFSVIYFTG